MMSQSFAMNVGVLQRFCEDAKHLGRRLEPRRRNQRTETDAEASRRDWNPGK